MQCVRRKWGYYITLLECKQFKIKLLRFKKDGQLSVQYHKHRNELWLFLTGKHKGEYWMINKNEVHNYYSEGEKPYILEIQFGDRCIEEDIVRI